MRRVRRRRDAAEVGVGDYSRNRLANLVDDRRRQFRDAVHRCPGGPNAAAVGPQAHTAQMRAPGKLRKCAILDYPGL
jgi:hypothetical protein